jgi:heme-degrading monooxygenase HmoA
MEFIQIIEGHTSHYDEMERLTAELEESADGQFTVRRSIRTQDRDDPSRFMVVVFFDSYESAMENSNLPETQEFSEKMMSLVDGPPKFHNLDVIEDKTF